jgi:hypothetical protein
MAVTIENHLPLQVHTFPSYGHSCDPDRTFRSRIVLRRVLARRFVYRITHTTSVSGTLALASAVLPDSISRRFYAVDGHMRARKRKRKHAPRRAFRRSEQV